MDLRKANAAFCVIDSARLIRGKASGKHGFRRCKMINYQMLETQEDGDALKAVSN